MGHVEEVTKLVEAVVERGATIDDLEKRVREYLGKPRFATPDQAMGDALLIEALGRAKALHALIMK